MSGIKRLSIMQIHLILAGLIMPAAILYFVSGMLYTSDVKGTVDKQEMVLSLEQPFRADLTYLSDIAQQALITHQLPQPDGEPYIKKMKDHYEFRWGDLRYHIKLSGKLHSRSATLIFKERSTLAQIMRIHRAEAGTVFKAVSLVMSVGLLIILISGVYLGITLPRFRKPLIIAVSTGSVLMILLII